MFLDVLTTGINTEREKSDIFENKCLEEAELMGNHKRSFVSIKGNKKTFRDRLIKLTWKLPDKKINLMRQNIRLSASIKAICILKYDFLQFHTLKKNDSAKYTLRSWRRSFAY